MSVGITSATEAERARRAAVMGGLAAFSEFIADHPDLPLGASDPFLYSAKLGSDEANRAEVDRVAAILGVAAGEAVVGTHYGCARDFGGGVTFSAWTFTAAGRRVPGRTGSLVAA